MHVTIYADKDTTAYGKRLTELGFTFDVRPFTSDITTAARDLYAARAESTDVIQFLIEDWTERRSLFGRHYGATYSTFRTCIMQYRRHWEDTAEHELLHAANALIFVYTGISLARIFGVSHFDQIVHGEAPGYREYHYDEVWKTIRPYLNSATLARRRIAYATVLERLRVTLRQWRLRDSEIEASLTPPVEGFPVTYAYGVADEHYPLTGHHIGTDYGCPVGTPVHAPADGEVTVAGYTPSLGYFCHFAYSHEGTEYVARFLHLEAIPTQGPYARGNIVGYSGDTGDATGPHLHVDVWRENVRLDLINRENWAQLTVNPEKHFGV